MIFNINSYTGNPEIENAPPEFEYTGDYLYTYEGEQNWNIKFLTSGLLSFSKLNNAINGIDVFIVGGGGGGGTNGGGGGSGFTSNSTYMNLEENLEYQIIIGDGGTPENNGNYTSAFSGMVNGGYAGHGTNGGSGGSGGGAGAYHTSTGLLEAACEGASNGNTVFGTSNRGTGGTGQGTSTRPFNDETFELYAGGGGGSNISSVEGAAGGLGGGGKGFSSAIPNTGGGGGGGTNAANAGRGGSGVVIIRNTRGGF